MAWLGIFATLGWNYSNLSPRTRNHLRRHPPHAPPPLSHSCAACRRRDPRRPHHSRLPEGACMTPDLATYADGDLQALRDAVAAEISRRETTRTIGTDVRVMAATAKAAGLLSADVRSTVLAALDAALG